jgi:Fe-S cluster biogenesis protein NfuA
MDKKIKKQLDKIRPYIQMDGGDVEFVSFEEKTGLLTIRLQGACVGCPMSQITLQEGIGKTIKAEIPEVVDVVAI